MINHYFYQKIIVTIELQYITFEKIISFSNSFYIFVVTKEKNMTTEQILTNSLEAKQIVKDLNSRQLVIFFEDMVRKFSIISDFKQAAKEKNNLSDIEYFDNKMQDISNKMLYAKLELYNRLGINLNDKF